MIFKEVESSNLQAVGFEPGVETQGGALQVKFKGGATYEYTDVPALLADELFAAESVGKFFNVNIRSQFTGKKLDVDDDD